MQISKQLLFKLSTILFLSIQIFSLSVHATARSLNENWSNPLNLSDSQGPSQFASITVDPSGVVHVVWNEQINQDEQVILYRRLENEVWSPALDIISNINLSEAPIIASDSRGYLHLIWQQAVNIYYSRAYAPLAGSARSWSAPQTLVAGENPLGKYDLAVNEVDGSVIVCVVHAKQVGENSGIFLTCSLDGGDSWNDRKLVYDNSSPDLMVNEPSLALTKNGDVHVVWVEHNYPETFPPLGIRYASSVDLGENWSSPRSLADGPYTDLEILIRDEDEIHVVWSGTAEDRYKFHRWSDNDGESWYPIWRNTEIGGLAGKPALITDSASHLYWLSVGDVFSLPAERRKDAFYYMEYGDNSWRPGSVIYQDPTELQNMKDVSAAIAQGNNLHVVVTSPLPTADGGYQMDILYFYRQLDSPFLAAQPLSAVDPNQLIALPTSQPEIVAVSPTRTPPLPSLDSPLRLQDPLTPVIIGVVPIILILLGIFMMQVLRGRR